MKFISTVAALSALTTSAFAATSTVSFYAQATSPVLNGAGVSSIHEGAAINYLPLGQGSPGQAWVYNDSDSSLTFQISATPSPITLSLTLFENILEFTPGYSNNLWTIDSQGVLNLNGSSSGFYGCMYIDDPYDYSNSEYFVLYYPGTPGSACIPITLTTEKPANATITSSVTTSAATSSFINSTTVAVSTSKSTSNVTATSSPSAPSTGAGSSIAANGLVAMFIAGIVYMI